MQRSSGHNQQPGKLVTWDCPLNSCGENSAYERWTIRGLAGEVLRVFEGKSSDTLAWKEDFVYRGAKSCFTYQAPS